MLKKMTVVAVAAAIGAGLCLAPAGRGCNPAFPSTVIGATDARLTAAPLGDFVAEVIAIVPSRDPGVKWVETDTATADAEDLKAAMVSVAGGKREEIVSALAAWRKAGLKGEPPADLPEEFRMYEAGAAQYTAGNLAGAREAWGKVLALAEGQRKFRTTWAAYMTARSFVESDPAKAADLFVKSREIRRGVFADSPGLASASLGWEARARWTLGQQVAAIELYLEQAHAGDPSAVWSLRDCVAELFKGDDVHLLAVAKDTVARQVVTGYLVAHSGPVQGGRVAEDELARRAKRWVALIAAARVQQPMGADRLAWLCYQSNDMAGADAWLKAGGEATEVGQWIRAKLLMRAGKVDAAMAMLAKAAAGFPKNEEWNAAARSPLEEDFSSEGDVPWRPAEHVAAELALLKLGRGQFVESLDLLFRAGFWQDAAYIAERVLTADELKAYVDKNWLKDPPVEAVDHNWMRYTGGSKAVPAATLRYLLARRLTRIGRWKEARGYYPEALQSVLDRYVGAIRDGHDAKRSAAERAASLWEAAQLARNRGLELLATEGSPDGAIWGGNFPVGPDVEERQAQATQPAVRKLSPVSAEELRRLARTPEFVEKRWEYRYTALDHAWAAAQLMPDGTDALAKLLVEAGGWVSAKDPKAADRFYKALVTRCAETTLGKEAARVKWFPAVK